MVQNVLPCYYLSSFLHQPLTHPLSFYTSNPRWSMLPRRLFSIAIPFLLLSSTLSPTTGLAQPALPYYQGSLEALQADAQRTQRPYLLYFYANWSDPCRQMETHTYRSPEVASYLTEHFFIYRVDVSSEDRGTAELPRRYSVFLFPTLVICSPEGEVLEEISGYFAPSKFIEELRPYEQTSQSVALSAPAPPAQQPQADFVVQVGVYGDYGNVERETQRLAERYQEPVRIVSGYLNGSDIHRVVVGPFQHQAEAKRFLQRFQATEGRAGIIKRLSQL